MILRNPGLPHRAAVPAVICAALASLAGSVAYPADDTWIEMKSAHFTVISNASEGATRTVAWQMEQIRSVLGALWPWARVDLTRPLTVVAVKDEGSMRALVPEYWERKNDVRPTSVWGSGADGPYITLRTDIRMDDRGTLNPHQAVYHSYVSLVLQSSAQKALPVWLSRGLSGVMSNTIVRDNFILLGPPIPWHVQRLRELPGMPLDELMTTTNSSRVFSDGDRMLGFDAQSWAVVHYLMFGNDGRMRAPFDQYLRDVFQGKDAVAAQASAFGKIQDLDAAVKGYVRQRLFPYVQADADVAIKREAFQFRRLPPAQSAASRAALHVALGHQNEALALIEAARKSDPNAAESYVSEGLLSDRASLRDQAQRAYTQAVERGSTSAWAHYRLASLAWPSNADREMLVQIEKYLSRAVQLNDRLAPAFALLGETRAMLDPKSDNALPVVRRAIALEPPEPAYRLTAARVLWGLGRLDEARVEAEMALSLARTDQETSAAQRLLRSMTQR